MVYLSGRVLGTKLGMLILTRIQVYQLLTLPEGALVGREKVMGLATSGTLDGGL